MLLGLLLAAPGSAVAPTGDFTVSPAAPRVGDSVTFTSGGVSDPAATIAWDFGDATAAGTGASASHTYATAGDMTVTMTLTNAAAESAPVTKTVHVAAPNAPPTAAFGWAPNVALIGQDVTFDGSGSSDPEGSALTYAWDFGGAGTRTGVNPTFPFRTGGTKTVTLTVTDAQGASAAVSQRVRVDRPPVASFRFAPTSPVSGQQVTFTSTSTDPDGAADLTAQQWDLNGDGVYTDASGPSATRVFSAAGSYTVGLQVADTAGAMSFQQRTVSVAGPPAPRPVPSPPAPRPGTAPSLGSPSPAGATPTAGGQGAGTSPTASGAPRVLALVARSRVRIAGSVASSFTRITRLVVFAPSGATVTARCAGAGCPAKAERHRIRRTSVRLRTMERTLKVGARILVSIRQAGFIGKQIEFTIHRGKPPTRRERCLTPGARAAAACPAL